MELRPLDMELISPSVINDYFYKKSFAYKNNDVCFFIDTHGICYYYTQNGIKTSEKIYGIGKSFCNKPRFFVKDHIKPGDSDLRFDFFSTGDFYYEPMELDENGILCFQNPVNRILMEWAPPKAGNSGIKTAVYFKDVLYYLLHDGTFYQYYPFKVLYSGEDDKMIDVTATENKIFFLFEDGKIEARENMEFPSVEIMKISGVKAFHSDKEDILLVLESNGISRIEVYHEKDLNTVILNQIASYGMVVDDGYMINQNNIPQFYFKPRLSKDALESKIKSYGIEFFNKMRFDATIPNVEKYESPF
jgi:hypothetical protein